MKHLQQISKPKTPALAMLPVKAKPVKLPKDRP